MSEYNEDLVKDDNSAEVTYYPEATMKTVKPRKIMKVFMFLLCMGVVSGVSISLYKVCNEASEYTNNDITSYSKSNNIISSILGNESSENMSIPEIVKKVKPSVVGISSEFFEGVTGTGTGIIMSESGYIVTNAHVVQNSNLNAKNVKVVLADKTEYDAQIVGADSRTDLAVIKIETEQDVLKAVEFGDSSCLVEGELAVAIGNPLGFELYGSTTCGIISALNRNITIDEYEMTLIQTDAAINPGNSGGPLLNNCGQVIGINSSKIISPSAEGLGFAIPINSAKPIIEDLINNGYVKGRPLIGISAEDIDSITARYYDLPIGVYVRFIESNSAADKCGIEVGDIITSVNGAAITTMSELNTEKDKFSSGDEILITVYRKNSDCYLEFNLLLDESKPPKINTEN